MKNGSTEHVPSSETGSMTDATRFQFNNPSVPKATTNFLCLDCSSLGQSYCSMKRIFERANRSSTSPLDLERLHAWLPYASAPRDVSSQPTSRSQCWISREPRIDHPPQLQSSTCALPPLLLRRRREHSMRFYVSKACSSFQTDPGH